MRQICLCGLALVMVLAASCSGDERDKSGGYDHVLSKNGMTFGPPFLTIQGSKEKTMSFDIWMNYSSSSFRCLGGAVVDGRDTWSFYAGGSGKAQKSGTAKRMYEVPAGQEEYSISIPLTLQDSRECIWHLQEVQMQIRDPFIQDRRDDLASFVLRDEAAMALPEAQYDTFCQRLQGRMSQFDCRHKSQNGRNVVVYSGSILPGAEITLNVKASADIRPAPYL